MSIAELIRAMSAVGAPAEAIALAVEAIEGAEARVEASRSAARERKRRQRSRDGHVTVTGQECDGHALLPETKVSPTPPSKTQTIHTPSPPKGGSVPTNLAFAKPNGFTRFWEAYPSKVGKRDAEKAYGRALKRVTGPDPPQSILAGIERAKLSRRWIEGYIPNPATWLNQDRWTDEPDETARTDLNRRSDPTDRTTSRTRVWAEVAHRERRSDTGGSS